MGVRIVVKDADFSDNAVGYIAPVPDGLEYLNFFGGSAARLQRNLAPGKPAGVMVGTPTINANSAVFTPLTHYIQTSAPDTNNKTMFVVTRAPLPKGSCMLLSNSRSARTTGPAGLPTTTATSLMFTTQDPDPGEVSELLFAAQWDGATDASSVPTTVPLHNIPVGAYSALIGRTNAGAGLLATTKYRKIDNKTTGAKNSASFTGAVFDLAGTFRIGSSYAVYPNTVPAEILFAAIWNRELTDVEIETMYQAVKSYYLRRGIVI